MAYKDKEKARAYQREYRKRRYHSDPEWRARVLRHSSKPEYRTTMYAKRLDRYRSDPAYRETVLKAVRRYRANNIEKVSAKERAKSRRRKTNWTKDQFDAAVVKQGGLCFICGKPPGKKGLQADHCHQTGATRDLLCAACNLWIGIYEADIERAKKRINYVMTWRARCNLSN